MFSVSVVVVGERGTMDGITVADAIWIADTIGVWIAVVVTI